MCLSVRYTLLQGGITLLTVTSNRKIYYDCCDRRDPRPQGAKRRKEVLCDGYPPVGTGAIKGVLSEGYMLACLLACADQVLHHHVHNAHSLYKNMAEKNGGNFRAFYTASDDRISLPEA